MLFECLMLNNHGEVWITFSVTSATRKVSSLAASFSKCFFQFSFLKYKIPPEKICSKKTAPFLYNIHRL